MRLDLDRNTVAISHGIMRVDGALTALVGLSSGVGQGGGSSPAPVDFGPSFMAVCATTSDQQSMQQQQEQAQKKAQKKAVEKLQEGFLGENVNIYAMLTDENSVYTADTGSPSVVLKMDKRTMSIVQSLKLNTGEDDVRTLVADEWHPMEEHLFACTNTVPAQVVKIHKATLSRTGALTLGAGQNSVISGTEIADGFLYVSTRAPATGGLTAPNPTSMTNCCVVCHTLPLSARGSGRTLSSYTRLLIHAPPHIRAS
jgi:hypothetical protein